MVHKEVSSMDFGTMAVQLGKTIWNAGGIGFWKYIIFAAFLALVALVICALFCKGDVGPNQHSLVKYFNKYEFLWYDGLEDTPELRPNMRDPRMYLLFWYKDWPKKWRIWWKARMTKRRNRLEAKAWRNSPNGNKAHELLAFGEPRLLGPGWHRIGPKGKIRQLDTEDTRNRVVNLTLYVTEDSGFRVYVLPIQLTIRIANLYLWKQTCNVVEGGVLGVARQKSRKILKLGYETIRSDDKLVAKTLMKAMSAKLKPEMTLEQQIKAMRGKIQWYGAEAIFVNPGAPEYQSVANVAEALRRAAEDKKQGDKDVASFEQTGAAVVAAMSIVEDDAPAEIHAPDVLKSDEDSSLEEDPSMSTLRKSMLVATAGAVTAGIAANAAAS